MSPQTTLSILTFLGLSVGFIGGLISQLTKTATELDGTTKKRLTTSGRWALAISLLGFSGSFSSEMLKSSIQAQQKVRADMELGLRQNREKEEDQWRKRSSELGDEILGKTNISLSQSEKNLTETIEGFQREQEGTLKTRLDIADSRQRVLNDNLMREASLYGRLSATSTPLTSMKIKLIVEHVPQKILEQVRRGIKAAKSTPSTDDDFLDLAEHHNVDDDDAKALVQSEMDKQVIQPFISFLGQDRFEKKHGILALALDKKFSALAAVGWVSRPDLINLKEGKSVLPSGVLIDSEIDFRVSYEEPPFKREKLTRPTIYLEVVGNSLILSLDLDVSSLDDSLLRYSTNSGKSSALPDEVELFSWSPSSEDELPEDLEKALELPFDSVKVRESLLKLDQQRNSENEPPDWLDTDSEWEHRNAAWRKSNAAWAAQMPPWMRRMRLQIIPNGIEQISKTYTLSLSSAGYPIEGSREDEPRGYVRIWHGAARKNG